MVILVSALVINTMILVPIGGYEEHQSCCLPQGFDYCLVSDFRGCGFVQFPDERLQKRALEECQGAVGLGGKPLRLSLAANK